MSIIIGVLSSLVASLIFLFGMRLLTPKIGISDYISAYPQDDDVARDNYRIKIINRRFRSVSDVSVQFFVQHLANVHGGSIKVRTPIGAKFNSHTLTRRRLRDTEWDNARRIRLDADELERVMCVKHNATITVEVYCRDSVSGIGRVFTRDYSLGVDSFKRASFKKGPSFAMEEYQGPAAFRLRDMIHASRTQNSAFPDESAEQTTER